MTKFYLSMLCLLLALVGQAQVVTTSPSPLSVDSKDVEIVFHADQGNKGLMGLSPSVEVYAHTGVNTVTADGKITTWKNAPTWGKNDAKYKLTYVSTNTYKLKIGDIRTYYNLASDELVSKLCFVFRTADSKKEGKDVGGADIFVEVKGGETPSKPSTLTEVPPYGATRNADGSVTFCLAAPEKKTAVIVGSWNGFKYDSAQTMDYIDETINGQTYRHFVITLPESVIARNQQVSYCYFVDGTPCGDPWARLVLDPWNDKYIPASVFPNLPAFPSDQAPQVPLAVWADNLTSYQWETSNFKAPGKNDLVIYELLFRDFTGVEGQALGTGYVRAAIEKIPYLKSLGVNAVELMPICEFNGNNSWGYNTNFYMATDKAYGTPQDYKEFIDKCHAAGIAVIVDMVLNHSDGLHPWYQLYPRANNPFYNAEAPHQWSVLNDWKQENPLVDRQWKETLQYWLSEFKVDGFRFDLVKGLGDSNSYGGGTDAYNQSRIDRMKRLHGYMSAVNPDAYFINENLAGYTEENKMAEDGEMNWFQMNEAACEYAMGYNNGKTDFNRMWAINATRTAGSTVAYMESHDEERVAYKVTQYAPAQVKGSDVVVCQRLGSAAAQMILSPGAHMIWQFAEMGNAQTTKDSSGGNNTDPKTVNWSLASRSANKDLITSYSELIAIRVNNPELFRSDAYDTFSMNCSGSDWANGRLIKSRVDGKELYVCINPNISGSVTINVPFNSNNSADYVVLSKSQGSTPSFNPTAKTVTVSANCYVVIATQGVSEVEGIEGTDGLPRVSVEGGVLSLSNCTVPVEIYDLSGKRVGESREETASFALGSGVYIVRSGAKAIKVAVR